ncbi:MAG: class A beta-lactamase-related serine hydrolase [Candidatus Dadabacteria bacterium]|nr:MAG: class A beta-lactamase-related serine hydrolase [Candidatus Dadabacteria bacterium]
MKRVSSPAEVLAEGVRRGVFPGAAAVVGRPGEVSFAGACGGFSHPEDERRVRVDTPYDVASLTKPLVTVSCLLRLVARGVVALEQPVADLLPEFGQGDPRRQTVRVEDLVRHRSGLPAWRPYFLSAPLEPPRGKARQLPRPTPASRRLVLDRALAEPLALGPGAEAVYSDVGFIVLGHLLERAAGCSLVRLARREVFEPLGLSCGFVDLLGGDAPRKELPPTGFCLWRQGLVAGVVHDENAYAMGGVAGHAGLFASAMDVFRIAVGYLEAYRGDSSWLEAGLVRRLFDSGCERSTWVGGWDTPSARGSSAGRLVSARAVGHLGFTGASVWIDLDREAVVAVASNRVHPDRHNPAIRWWRPLFHDAAFSHLDGEGQ